MENRLEQINIDEQFYQSLVRQIRSIDIYGSYAKFQDHELIGMKYIKTVENTKDVKKSEVKNDQIAQNIKVYLQAICVMLEKITGQIISLMTETGCDGSVQVIMYTGELIILNKTFGGISGFEFSTIDKLKDYGTKLAIKLLNTLKIKTEKYGSMVQDNNLN
ncbi:MAG: DUF269 domain-containing protein [Spirochaetia bacterium]|nr:DUF269 domain-containing protein [Spirochaetia bacterium]